MGVFLSIGSNLSDVRGGGRRLTILRALDRLNQCDEIEIIDTSSFYECAPYPSRNIPIFLRQCVELKTSLLCERLFEICCDIEYSLGGHYSSSGGSKIIEIILLDYKGQEIETDNYFLPVQGLYNRAEFLLPLAEVASEWCHPISKTPIRDLIDGLSSRQHVKRAF